MDNLENYVELLYEGKDKVRTGNVPLMGGKVCGDGGCRIFVAVVVEFLQSAETRRRAADLCLLLNSKPKEILGG